MTGATGILASEPMPPVPASVRTRSSPAGACWRSFLLRAASSRSAGHTGWSTRQQPCQFAIIVGHCGLPRLCWVGLVLHQPGAKRIVDGLGRARPLLLFNLP